MCPIPIFYQCIQAVLLVVVWTAAVLLRRVGVPTIFGELIAGVILGPAVIGKNVRIGSDSVVSESVLWDGSRVGNNCFVKNIG